MTDFGKILSIKNNLLRENFKFSLKCPSIDSQIIGLLDLYSVEKQLYSNHPRASEICE